MWASTHAKLLELYRHELGSGKSATVTKQFSRWYNFPWGAYYARKQFKPEGFNKKRFHAEVEALKTIQQLLGQVSPKLYAWNLDKRYIDMEYIPGSTLNQLVSKNRQMYKEAVAQNRRVTTSLHDDFNKLQQSVVELIDTLVNHNIHPGGDLHGDNIIIDSDFKAKMIDLEKVKVVPSKHIQGANGATTKHEILAPLLRDLTKLVNPEKVGNQVQLRKMENEFEVLVAQLNLWAGVQGRKKRSHDSY